MIARLRGRPPGALPGPRTVEAADPYGEDVHLALHPGYELRYGGFSGAPDDTEGDVDLLRLRAECGRPSAPSALQVWVLPRLRGRAKAGRMTVLYDDLGCGRGRRMHARL